HMSRFRFRSGMPTSAITPERVWLRRRKCLQGLAVALPLMLAGCGADSGAEGPAPPVPRKPLAFTPNAAFSTGEARTSEHDATHYNNYYEFGTGKDDPAARSARFEPEPWTIE